MASTREHIIYQHMERIHQDWRQGDLKELAAERRRMSWRGWEILGGGLYGAVGVVDISSGCFVDTCLTLFLYY